MSVQQVSVFVENKPGTLSDLMKLLKSADVNMRALSLAETQNFGIVRLIVDKSEEAKSALEKAGYQCRLDKVLAIDMASDKPGTLNRILSDLQNANVMIRYLYISFDRSDSTPIAVFCTDEPETETFLRGKGYRLLDRF